MPVWLIFAVGLCVGQEVDVYVVDRAAVSPALMHRATAQASELLKAAGVRMTWKSGRPPEEARGCPAIAVTIEKDAPPDLKAEVRGQTRLNDGSVTVFYDRIRPALSTWPSLAPTLLAQVLAHEIGHSLQGVNRHSDRGTMKAYWGLADYRAMQERQLSFSATDARLMRAGIERCNPAE